jgi:hypothetical protein
MSRNILINPPISASELSFLRSARGSDWGVIAGVVPALGLREGTLISESTNMLTPERMRPMRTQRFVEIKMLRIRS